MQYQKWLIPFLFIESDKDGLSPASFHANVPATMKS